MKVSHRITRLAPRRSRGPRRSPPPPPARGPRPTVGLDRTTGEPFVIEPEAPVVQSVDEGFDWASAAIGAGIAGGMILLISWGGVTYRHRHEHIGLVH